MTTLQEDFWNKNKRPSLRLYDFEINEILSTLSKDGWIKNDGSYVKKENVINEIGFLEDAIRQKINQIEKMKPTNQEYTDKNDGMIAMGEDILNNFMFLKKSIEGMK